MCLIAYKERGEELDKEKMRRIHLHNPDGTGYCWLLDGKFRQIKNFDFNKVWSTYQKEVIDKGLERKAITVCHSRIKTRGSISLENVQPIYMENQNAILVHNGTINSGVLPKDTSVSDSIQFSELVDGLPLGWEDNQSIKRMIKDIIGYSRILVLFDDYRRIIFNEIAGHWKDGIWYSKIEKDATYLRKKHSGKEDCCMNIRNTFFPSRKNKGRNKKKKNNNNLTIEVSFMGVSQTMEIEEEKGMLEKIRKERKDRELTEKYLSSSESPWKCTKCEAPVYENRLLCAYCEQLLIDNIN